MKNTKQSLTLGLLLQHPAHFIALGAGAGLSPWAPGTVATVWAWLSYHALSLVLPEQGLLFLIACSLPVAVWSSKVLATKLATHDPSCVVIDEILAFWAVLWCIAAWPRSVIMPIPEQMPAPFILESLAFILFRLLDIFKFGPIGWADKRFKTGGWIGGFGIVFDDLLAAFFSVLLLFIGLQLYSVLWLAYRFYP